MQIVRTLGSSLSAQYLLRANWSREDSRPHIDYFCLGKFLELEFWSSRHQSPLRREAPRHHEETKFQRTVLVIGPGAQL